MGGGIKKTGGGYNGSLIKKPIVKAYGQEFIQGNHNQVLRSPAVWLDQSISLTSTKMDCVAMRRK